MLSPDDPEARHIVDRLVRDVAAETGFTTLLRIGEAFGEPFAYGAHFIHEPGLDYGQLLQVLAGAERARPIGLPNAACALLLPDRDIAYVKHGTAPMTTLTIGRDPVDDPDTHQGVQAGLDALMRAIADTQPATRPAGRPFPPTPPGRMPNTSTRFNPRGGWTPPPSPGPDRPGPHR